ncbi:MAG: NADP-dependent phosphogluconate dehydrogenase [Bacilli bacterium]
MNSVGLYGLGVMGKSLVSNINNNGYSVGVYNINPDVGFEFAKNKVGIHPYKNLRDFVMSLEKPRKIILMVTAGKIVDDVCNSLIPLIEKNDIIIDCGNSFYLDSEKRQLELKKKGIYFLGVGVSGGEKGALKGPSIMPSGDYDAYQSVKSILETISAKNANGEVCCSYIGSGGSGHFVKMVHNGIEYAEMQLIADIFSIVNQIFNSNQLEIIKSFEDINKGELKSYLLQITINILKKKDEDNSYLVNNILDIAKQKGTGKWVAQVAMNYGENISLISNAVAMRFLSTEKQTRLKAENIYRSKESSRVKESILIVKKLEHAMYFVKVCIYAQAFSLISKVSNEHDYGINLQALSLIWQEGCIIKSDFLKEICKVYSKESDENNLILSDYFINKLKEYDRDARDVLIYTIENKISSTMLSDSIQYFDALTSGNSSTNIIQAQRDYFGAHTYERNDIQGVFHTIWE